MLMHVVCGNAAELSVAYGNRLVGARAFTSALSRWQGDVATIIEIQPDPAAPEIPLQVKHAQTGEEIGVFGDEYLMVDAMSISNPNLFIPTHFAK